MKKYVILAGELLLSAVFLWLFFWNNWITVRAGNPYQPKETLHPGQYWIVARLPIPAEITFFSKEKTNTLSLPKSSSVTPWEIHSPTTLLDIPKNTTIIPKQGLLFHSFLGGVVIILVIFSLFWWKTTKGIPAQWRMLLFAFAFGWSGSLSVIFLVLAMCVGLSRWVRHPRVKWYYGFVGVFFLWVVMSGFFVRFPLDAVGSAFLFLLYIMIAIFTSVEKENIPWEKIGIAIVSAFLMAGLIGLTQQWYIRQDVALWAGNTPLLLWPYNSKELASLFEWSARGGYWLGIMIPVVLALFFHTQEKRNKFIFVFGGILGLLLLVLTQSRGGFVLAFVGIFTQLLFRKRGYLALLLFLIPLVVLFVAPQSKWAQSIRNPFAFHTDTQRFHQIRAALDFWHDANPLIGIGLMNYRSYYYEKRHDYDIYSVADYLHMGYMAILLETGVVGFISFYGFLIIVWLSLLRKSLRYRYSFYPMILGMINSFFISLVFDAMLLYAFYLGIWMWFWLGVAERKELEKS